MTDPESYLEVVYSEAARPLTAYPRLLATHLAERFGLVAGERILDVGCGRGEFLAGFAALGLVGAGVDQSAAATRICPPECEIRTANLADSPIPFDDRSFDVVFSKSVVEHFYHPERLFSEFHRVLRPGGRLITLTPDWRANHVMFFEDYTHRTPFTIESLRDIQLMHRFVDVQCEYFLQIPAVWRHRTLRPLSWATRYGVPSLLKPHSKFVRFSKEVMLLSHSMRDRVP